MLQKLQKNTTPLAADACRQLCAGSYMDNNILNWRQEKTKNR
jgi:hypothetical protein